MGAGPSFKNPEFNRTIGAPLRLKLDITTDDDDDVYSEQLAEWREQHWKFENAVETFLRDIYTELPDDPLELLEAQLDKFRVAERTAMDDGGQNGIRTPRSAARAGATRRAFFAEGKISRRSVRRSVGQ